MEELIENGVPFLWETLKKELEQFTISTLCTYEGCGSDDGWPNFVPMS